MSSDFTTYKIVFLEQKTPLIQTQLQVFQSDENKPITIKNLLQHIICHTSMGLKSRKSVEQFFQFDKLNTLNVYSDPQCKKSLPIDTKLNQLPKEKMFFYNMIHAQYQLLQKACTQNQEKQSILDMENAKKRRVHHKDIRKEHKLIEREKIQSNQQKKVSTQNESTMNSPQKKKSEVNIGPLPIDSLTSLYQYDAEQNNRQNINLVKNPMIEKKQKQSKLTERTSQEACCQLI